MTVDPEPIDIDDLIEETWPYDGPHNREKTMAAARMIAGLVRYIDNATYQPHAYQYASSVDVMLSNLKAAVGGLEQLLTQAFRFLANQDAAGTLYDNRDPQDPALAHATVEELRGFLDFGRLHAARMADSLHQAHSATNRLGNHTDEAGKVIRRAKLRPLPAPSQAKES